MDELLKKFEKLALKNKLGHAYILYNVNYEDIAEQLEDIIYKYFFKSTNKNNFKSDIYLVNPENNNISKDQIKELQRNIKTCSQVSENKIYIINSCDKMNLSAANSMLKFLEEPENNIYAFLITNDIDKVLNTIISRCIKIFIKNKSVNINTELQEKILKIFTSLFNPKDKDNISIIYDFFKKLSKEEFKEINDNLILLLKDFININHNRNTEYYNYENIKSLNNLTSQEIINKIILLNSLNERLNYNVNIQMLADKLVINW